MARVISGEGQPRAGPAAHEALAIVIRTFALANRRRHRAEGYDLCDSTHCQVMRPAHCRSARQAAQATAGRVLLDEGQPAFVYYSAHCGGIPALASEVWPGAVDYRPGSGARRRLRPRAGVDRRPDARAGRNGRCARRVCRDGG